MDLLQFVTPAFNAVGPSQQSELDTAATITFLDAYQVQAALEHASLDCTAVLLQGTTAALVVSDITLCSAEMDYREHCCARQTTGMLM